LDKDYKALSYPIAVLTQKIQQWPRDSLERRELLEEKHAAQRRRLTISSSDQYDPDFRRLRYGRSADDFVLGVIGPQSEAAISSSDQYDPDFRRLRYGRSADDFVLGVIGPKSCQLDTFFVLEGLEL